MVKRLREKIPEWGYKVIAFVTISIITFGVPLIIWGLTVMIDVTERLGRLDGIADKVNRHETQIAVINQTLKINNEANYGKIKNYELAYPAFGMVADDTYSNHVFYIRNRRDNGLR